MRKCIVITLCLLLAALALAGCGGQDRAPSEPLVLPGEQVFHVGICLPENAAPWNEQGGKMLEQLSAGDWEVQLNYAENDVQIQLTQVMKLIENDVKCLVIAPVDSLSLLPALELAEQKKIPVIAYDRLLLQSESLCLYIAFDSYGMGKALGEKIVAERALATALQENRVVTAELMMDSPGEHASVLFYQGLMAALQPYLDTGALVCRSGRTSLEDTCVTDGSAAAARQRLQQYLNTYYTDAPPALCIAASAELAQGCKSALAERETTVYTAREKGNYGPLTDQCIAAVKLLLAGKTPEGSGQTVSNGVAQVNAWLVSFE